MTERNFAPGVSFNEEKHEYWYQGAKLSGVTGRIAAFLGKKMPDGYAGAAQADGVHVHKAVETWLNGGGWGSVHGGALWVREHLLSRYANPPDWCRGEVLVSDFTQYASMVDIVAYSPDGSLSLFDMKRSFNRLYVTIQLNIYKRFIERADKTAKVSGLFCLAVRDRYCYELLPMEPERVDGILYGKPGLS